MDGVRSACGTGDCDLTDGAFVSAIGNDVQDIRDGNGLKPSTILHLCGYGLLIFGLAFMVKQWHEEGVGRARAEATQEAEKNYRAAVEQERKEKLAEISKDVKDAKTPEQAIHILPKYVPVPFNVPTYVTPTEGKLPDAPKGQGYSLLNDGDQILAKDKVIPMLEFGAKCKEDGINLGACEKNLASMTTERDKWKLAARGGSRWSRLGKALKIIGCGAAGGAAGSLAKQRAAGAAIGAAVGSGACTLLF